MASAYVKPNPVLDVVVADVDGVVPSSPLVGFGGDGNSPLFFLLCNFCKSSSLLLELIRVQCVVCKYSWTFLAIRFAGNWRLLFGDARF